MMRFQLRYIFGVLGAASLLFAILSQHWRSRVLVHRRLRGASYIGHDMDVATPKGVKPSWYGLVSHYRGGCRPRHGRAAENESALLGSLELTAPRIAIDAAAAVDRQTYARHEVIAQQEQHG